MTALTTRSERSPAVNSGALSKAPVRGVLATLAVILVVAVVEYLGNSLSLWWITLAVGIVAGWVVPRRRTISLAVGTILAWGIGILVESAGRTLAIAGVVSALAINARSLGWLIIVITLIYAVLLALAGSWFGAAARRMLLAYRRVEAAPQRAAGPPAAEDTPTTEGTPTTDTPSPADVEEPSNV